MEKRRISLCVLLFGDYLTLARRCLDSVSQVLPEGKTHLQDIRLVQNQLSRESFSYSTRWALDVSEQYGIPVIRYVSPQNARKYPLMRRVLHDDPVYPSEFVMWFDDDSFLASNLREGWWSRVLAAAERCDMIGKIYRQPLQGQQWSWIIRQPWYNPKVGKPPQWRGRLSFRFVTGGWWMIRYDTLRVHDWPSTELRHCGGDSMLGELMRHQGLRMGEFVEGVWINSREAGTHSTARRRGICEPVIGKHFDGTVEMEFPHQNFSCARIALPLT